MSTDTATSVETFTFAVYNLDENPPFEAFLIDVPTTLGEDAAARRAYFAAMATLSQQGVEPEDFMVACWRNNAPGPMVTSAGIDEPGRRTG